VEYIHIFLPLLKFVSKILCHVFIVMLQLLCLLFCYKRYVCIPRSFLVINVCNQKKTLCSFCIYWCIFLIRVRKKRVENVTFMNIFMTKFREQTFRNVDGR
jgi:hypothetical protein